MNRPRLTTTNAKLAQRKQLDENDIDAGCCECGQLETAQHILCECTCERYVNVRQAFSAQRAKLVSSSPYSEEVKATFREIHEIKSDGTYPDLTTESELWHDDHVPSDGSTLISDYKNAQTRKTLRLPLHIHKFKHVKHSHYHYIYTNSNT